MNVQPRQLVFVDESGDPGLSVSRSSHFIIAAVVVVDETEDVLIRAKIREYRRSLGWRDDHEFKFNKVNKTIAKNLIKLLSPYDYKVYAVVLNKNSQITPDNRYTLYNQVLVELVKRLDMANVNIRVDGDVGKTYRKKTLTFLRRELSGKTKISTLRYEDSRKVDELQLADIAAGSINRSLSDKKDAGDYVKLFGDKIIEIYNI
jgi:hypothetical protein